jgi:RNA polymerase sporulation-specific sigma factor
VDKYRDKKDEQLIELAHAGNNQVVDFLMDKYKDFVRKKAREMYLIGGDNDDLIQEGMIGLFKAIRDYKSGRDATFFTFADLCISRQMYTAIHASNRKKHIPLNTYISFYSSASEDDNEGSDLLNQLRTGLDKNPEELFIDKENIGYIEEKLQQNLSAFELEVANLHIAGITYSQIAQILEKSPKSVDNAIQRIKSKMSVILEEM